LKPLKKKNRNKHSIGSPSFHHGFHLRVVVAVREMEIGQGFLADDLLSKQGKHFSKGELQTQPNQSKELTSVVSMKI